MVFVFQVFHCHFNSNFFPLFLEALLGNSVSQTFSSVLLGEKEGNLSRRANLSSNASDSRQYVFISGVSFVAPHINNLYFLSLCRTYGVYSVIKFLFIIKLTLSGFMLIIGPSYTLPLCLFIAR